jgi:hypothetical protein
MHARPVSFALVVACAAQIAAIAASRPHTAGGALLFSDDFANGLDRWSITGERAIGLHDSGDAAHGRVLELTPNGDVVALIRGSDRWGPVRLEGEMLFPTDIDNYLGFVYNHGRTSGRQDFGVIYAKGNESYLQVNPHRDFNVSRTLYPELHATLTGAAAIVTGRWQRFAVEVSGSTAHVYVGDDAKPQLTFNGFERERGALGLQPRSVGGSVWVDNVTVRAIERLAYDGPPIPAAAYDRAALLRDWQLAGPFAASDDRVARHPERARWTPFAVDARGAVVTGRSVDYHGTRTVAYFRTRVTAKSAADATLEISTVDDLALWVNGRFHWFIARQGAAWFDFATNKAHAGQQIPVELRAGINQLVFRVRGGVYASGGFFARVVQPKGNGSAGGGM